MEFWRIPEFWIYIIRGLEVYTWIILIHALCTWFLPPSHPVMRVLATILSPVLSACSFARIRFKNGSILDLTSIAAYLVIRMILMEAAYQAYLIFCS